VGKVAPVPVKDDALVDRLEREYDQVDVLISNAVMLPFELVERTTDELSHKVI
jgi:NAD(P)-dependent dehydrogenase (short-subunit alcohol dehydrogenase family)